MTTPVFYPAENLPSLFNVEGIPATFIFDEKGNLVTQIEGGDDYDTEKYLNLFNK
jgi:thioredoxin-related protein